MRVARGFDATDGAEPYFSAARPRLAEPEMRSRVAGYLGSGPSAGPGWRTDGVWLWPESLADHVRVAGVGPTRELLDHIAARGYLCSGEVGADVLARARSTVSQLVGSAGAGSAGAGSAGAGSAGAGSAGVDLLGVEPAREGDREAARRVDRRCAEVHEALLRQARESQPPATGPRVARLFDAMDASGAPSFSPSRLRIVARERRDRLAAYLVGGRLVVRATGRMVDPLEPARGRVVPLNYRTDGTWVWPEALGYYLRHRGVAPELELLCHIEEHGLRLPESLGQAAVTAAVAAVRSGPGPREPTAPVRYYRDERSGRLLRVPGGDWSWAQVLDADLSWRCLWPESGLADGGDVAAMEQAREIDVANAVQLIDERWSQLARGRDLGSAR